MFYVGIDIGKRNHEAVVTDENGSIVIKAFRFTNNLTGYLRMTEKLKKITVVRSQFIFGMESTAHYWHCIPV